MYLIRVSPTGLFFLCCAEDQIFNFFSRTRQVGFKCLVKPALVGLHWLELRAPEDGVLVFCNHCSFDHPMELRPRKRLKKMACRRVHGIEDHEVEKDNIARKTVILKQCESSEDPATAESLGRRSDKYHQSANPRDCGGASSQLDLAEFILCPS